jgi:hypothetical protein
LEKGFKVVVVDNLSNSSEEAIRRTRVLAGDKGKDLIFYKVCVFASCSSVPRAWWQILQLSTGTLLLLLLSLAGVAINTCWRGGHTETRAFDKN